MPRLEARVVARGALGRPVAPAPASRADLIDAGGLFGAGQQPVGLIEGMLRNPLARKDGLHAVLQQRAAADTAALRASAAARNHGASRRGPEDNGEMPAVRARHPTELES